MAFLFGRGRGRTNMIDLAKQARDQVLRLDGPGGPAKVTDTNLYTAPAAPSRDTLWLYPDNGALTASFLPTRQKNWLES